MALQSITLGHIEAHEKLTARLFLLPDVDSVAGDVDTENTGYRNLGNVLDYKYAPERQYRTRMRADNGVRIANDEEVDTVHDRWEFTLDEAGKLNLELLGLSAQTTDVSQSATNGVTVQIAKAGLNQYHPLGASNISSVTVTDSVPTTYDEGDDYTVDLDTGMLYIPTGSSITPGTTLNVTFNRGARTFQQFNHHQTFRFEGTVLIMEMNQHSKEPLRIIQFRGTMVVTAYPEQTGEFGKYVVRVTPLESPVWMRRQAEEN